MKDGSNNVHYIDGGFRFGDGVRKLHQRAKTLRALELESGSAIEYSGTNNFIMGTGIVYGGLNDFSLTAYDSATTQFTYVYSDNDSGWTETGSNTIDYSHYDDGDGTLGNIGNNKYSVHYVYKHIDDNDVYVVYGTGSYTLAEAEIQAIIPPTIPAHLTDFGCQIGTIIAPQAGGSFTAVIMVTSQFFSGTEVVNHNNLGGLQGGIAGEEYHLTETQHTNNAYTTDKLSAFAATTSAELAGVISDETGTLKLVYSDSPVFTTKISTPQVTFPSTQSASADANTLDDYEEGTWTPILQFGGASVGITYSKQTGLYTKIGRQVTITANISLTAKGSSTGMAKIEGLPFTCMDNDGAYSVPSFYFYNITFADRFIGFIIKNTKTINLKTTSEAGIESNITNTNFADNSVIVITATYFTD